jgi:hypothetical protein
MVYTVDYDLMSPGQDYTSLRNALVALGAKPMMKSKWVLQSNSTAAAIRDHLKQFIDSNDRLFVAELSGQWASYNIMVDLNTVAFSAPATFTYRR